MGRRYKINFFLYQILIALIAVFVLYYSSLFITFISRDNKGYNWIKQFKKVSEVFVYITNSINNIDTGITGTLIGSTFSLMGFSVTLRNLLISKDSTKYNEFSLKEIIEVSHTFFGRLLWYIILIIPIHCLCLYMAGYRRRLFFYLALSIVCVIVYFFITLNRLNQDKYNKVVANILLENILNSDLEYGNNYYTFRRKEYLEKISNSNNSKIEIINIFFEKLKKVASISDPAYGVINRKIDIIKILLVGKLIENSIIFSLLLDKGMSFKNFGLHKGKFIKNVCLKSVMYIYDYFSFEILHCSNEWEFEQYYQQYLKQIIYSLNYYKNNVNLVLYTNVLFGIILSCFKRLNLNVSKKIVDDIYTSSCRDDLCKVSFIPEQISAMIVVALNYLSYYNLFDKEIFNSDLCLYYQIYFENTCLEDYELLRSVLNVKVWETVNQNTNMDEIINKICDCIKNSFDIVPIFLIEGDYYSTKNSFSSVGLFSDKGDDIFE